MERRGLVGKPVEGRLDARALVASELEQRGHCARLEKKLLFGGEVELGAVARREHDGLAAVRQRAGERCRAVEIDGNALAELHRCLVVRDADERQVHGLGSVMTRSG